VKALQTLAKMLGVPTRLAEDALHSESAARAVLSRRNLFAAAGALAVGSVLVGGPIPLYVFSNDHEWFVAANLDEAYGHREDWSGLTREDDNEGSELVQLSPRHYISIYVDEDSEIAPVDEGEHTISLTAAAWALREGPGFLCTTEY
jgi:hypothetical protein